MPHKVTLEDGTEMETFTAEEVAAKAKEETDRIEAEKQAEIDRIEAERATEKEELEKLRNKDMNFENLRKKADGNNTGAEEVKKQIDELTKRLDVVATQPILEVKTQFIKTKIGEDKEKKELFEHYFKQLGADAKTKEEVEKACNGALMLATNGQYQPNGNNGVTGTQITQNYRQENTSGISEDSKVFGAALGITPEDRKKYGKKNN